LIGRYGTNALVVDSPASEQKGGELLFAALESAGIRHTQTCFSGHVTLRKAHEIAARGGDIDLVIGMGGGRVLDVAKLVGTFCGVPVVTVPTIAATCAAWAAVSIVYDEEGRFSESYFNTVGPELVLADTKILFEAPRRYLWAGIVDTFAKWYEIIPYERLEGASTFLRTMIQISAQLRDTLTRCSASAIRKFEEGELGDEAVQVIDAVIFLAGLTGSMQTDTLYQGIAHPFYNAMSYFPESGHLLHGEKVGFGVLLQQVLEGKTSEEIEGVIRLFAGFGNTLTLRDMKLEGQDELIWRLAEHLWEVYRPSLNRLGYGFSASEIYDGIRKTDGLIRASL
jgi:glycerol dehydrogenase